MEQVLPFRAGYGTEIAALLGPNCSASCLIQGEKNFRPEAEEQPTTSEEFVKIELEPIANPL